MFETKEVREKLSDEIAEEKSLKKKIEDIRRNKKTNFRMNSGTINLATIHSFKGWEIDTLFLIIESDNESADFLTDEFIYTAITRCRFNLHIINMGNRKYHSFFDSNVNQ